MKSKAVLEFEYPEDEDTLRHALKGAVYYAVLQSIVDVLYSDATNYYKLKNVRVLVAEALEKELA